MNDSLCSRGGFCLFFFCFVHMQVYLHLTCMILTSIILIVPACDDVLENAFKDARTYALRLALLDALLKDEVNALKTTGIEDNAFWSPLTS